MKLPRDIDAAQLTKALRQFNYNPTRQTGSHIRLTSDINGQHHITIPNHTPLKIGTLNAILSDVANHLGLSKQELINRLF
ncbi:HicA-like toxin of HicAB toxin-antitoxin system [Breznakibacter xylanolyticus]|uniref:HicA-like toxin of HicAB toxin-antitoxin system n=1 Tax=Breznakibacter xylanolyticus TaxID=990 RepID=A0A2W7NDE0_9BACT|nr:type II toxin-antitoxin system HicA family toxin [Breznakibacter xylanolyticus]PZX16157.1 HicA-like toxin of HicAB toxin-antitoxin system [Breznakibacter xylanolyticus]